MKARLALPYNDYCRIWRGIGEVDEDGNEIMGDLLYEGVCDYQVDMGGNMHRLGGQWQSNPTIFLPVNDIIFETNDIVEVTLKFGRVVKSTVKQYDIDDVDNCEGRKVLEGTQIWLKEGRDGQE